ncbi:LrgB family protein [Paenibacillus wulumuqiensis]|uniref:LrgB family protein n=1 Tax=Paenibacillus wulumuqiensis TaxID=1567107 RepID=UPI0006193BC8|nr:LrgB family protein [Paenibacillus wulumuqiensis]
MSGILSAVIVLLTVLIYAVMAIIYKKFKLPILMPALTGTAIIVIILLNLNISYSTYMEGGQWINKLLGPAVVALAYPLYKQRHQLLKNWLPIVGGSLAGVFAGMLSGMLLALAFGFSKPFILSIVPKSVTTPVAIQIVNHLGADSSLTSVFVMIAGFTGAVCGVYLLRLFRIHHVIGSGIALGSSSHALGTAKAMEIGEQASSMSSIAMTISAIVASFIAPLVVWIVFH